MFYESQRAPDGQLASGPPSSADEVFETAKRSAWYVDNIHARDVALEEAYDRRIDAIKAATGVELANPRRRVNGVAPIGIGLVAAAQEAGDAAFMRELATLAEQHPDKVDIIRADRSPREDALAIRNAAEKAAREAYDRYDGPWGTGALASFAGGVAGGLSDPVNLLAMLINPNARAGVGLKSMLWMAIKQGAANAGVEAAAQPAIYAWRKEAGLTEPALDYTPGTFAMNVGTAFALGFAPDVAVRGVARAIQRGRGLVPKLDDTGGVIGWHTPEQALEEAAIRSNRENLRKAAEGDTEALRGLAREAGIADNPEVKALFATIDNAEATATRIAGVDADDDAARALQTLRHLINPNEPLPVDAVPVPEAKGPRLGDADAPPAELGASFEVDGKPVSRVTANPDGEGRAVLWLDEEGNTSVLTRRAPEQAAEAYVFRAADGWSEAQARVHAARKELRDEPLDVLEAARLMRDNPAALDQSVSLASAEMRQARAIARLSDEAFDNVLAGTASPELGAIVADHEPNVARHGWMLSTLQQAGPSSPAEARQILGLLQRGAGKVGPARAGLDDPRGAAAQRQIEALERQLEEAPEQPRPTYAAEREAIEATPEVSLKRMRDEVDMLERMGELITECKF